MMMTDSLRALDGVTLHVHQRGQGPLLVLVPGAGGDADQYEALASQLANDHTVVTYDRRANSRSPRPADWAGTTVEEQADDLAALIASLGAGPAAVFGNSLGAVVALACALRSPSAVSTLVLHEPALMSVLADPAAAMAAVQPVIGAGMAAGGMRGGAEAFLRFADEKAYEALPDLVRERMLGNAEVLFESELATLGAWRPDEAAVAALPVAVAVLRGRLSGAPTFAEAAQWLVTHSTADTVVEVPGGHMGFVDEAEAFAAALRPLLRG